MPTDEQVAQARKRLEEQWDQQGGCDSCGWHALLGEYYLDNLDIRYALEDGGTLRLPCLSKDDSQADLHRGVRVYIGERDDR